MVDSRRLSEELGKMKKLIAENDEVKARFDLDGDGHIDGHEWEQVRLLVIARLEREEAEQAAASAEGESVASQASSVADRIYSDDLQATSNAATTLAEAEDLVLTQKGGLGQMFEGAARREYEIHNRNGVLLGSIRQNVSDMIASLGKRPLAEMVIDYSVFSGMSSIAVFRCADGLAGSRLDILDGGGGQLGSVTWKAGLLRPSFRVVSTFERGAMEIKAPLLRPWTFTVKNDIGEAVGTIERGWSGLGGFLTGGNRMRIHTETGRTTENQRFALLAAALLADLMAEDKRRRD